MKWLKKRVLRFQILRFVICAMAVMNVHLAFAEDDFGRPEESKAAFQAYGEASENLDYETALIHARQMLAIDEALLGADAKIIAIDLNILAFLLEIQAKYAEAKPLYERSLKIREAYFGKDDLLTAVVVNNLALLLKAQGKYDEAEPLFVRSLNIRKAKTAEDSVLVADGMNNLATLYHDQGNYEKAEPLYRQSLTIFESRIDEDPLAIARAMSNLAVLLETQGQYEKSGTFFRRSLDMRIEALGLEHPSTADGMNNFASYLQWKAQYKEAEKYSRQALGILENLFGPDHPRVGNNMGNLANILKEQGRYTEAEDLANRALEISIKKLGPDHPTTASRINNLAVYLDDQGRYASAESHYKRAIEILEATLGPDHPSALTSVNNLSVFFQEQGRYEAAEVLARRVLLSRTKILGEMHPDTAMSMNDLAHKLQKQGRGKEARDLYLKALSITQAKLGVEHPFTNLIRSNLGTLLLARGQHEEAILMFRRVLTSREKTLGTDHPDTATSRSNLASALGETPGGYKEAEKLYRHSLEAVERKFGLNHPATALGHWNSAWLYWEQPEPITWLAAFHFKTAATAWSQRALSGVTGKTANAVSNAQTNRELNANTRYFYMHAVLNEIISHEEHFDEDSMRAESFEAAQWAQRTSAGAALTQAAARFASGDDGLAQVVRNRQDLANQWGATDALLIKATSADEDKRDAAREKLLRDRLVSIDATIAEINARLEKEFPEYAALTSPAPLSLVETQALIADDEALVMFLAGEEGTLVFALTKEDVTWSRVDMDKASLSETVRVLRISLDDPSETFPRAMAHGVYKALMGSVGALIADKKHVFLVPSGALGSIPLGVLVTEPPEGDDEDAEALRATSWWGTQQALTTLPSVSSLKALRLLAKDGRGREPFAGFGDPVLSGPKDARAQDRASRGVSAYFRDGTADVDALRTLSPLPQTADEIRTLAKALKTRRAKKSIYLGARATEANVKQADLSQKRVVVFATHGLMSGQMNGLSEPALVLTPPDDVTSIDDGLLTASEAAQLNLNADWVILSACNTAAADAPGADGLSGLARAFFYAGAKAMLVSHWPVRDDAAARLTTQAIRLQEKDGSIGRAEALRRSMITLMNDTSDDSLAHPSAWAPFVVVGEGGTPIAK